MSDARRRILAGVGGLAVAAAIKWVFDRWLWDAVFGALVHLAEFDRAELITAVLSYLLPLVAAALLYARLTPALPADDRPVLRRRPWQSRRLLVGVLLIIAAVIAGLNYGRLTGLPSITLPAAR